MKFKVGDRVRISPGKDSPNSDRLGTITNGQGAAGGAADNFSKLAKQWRKQTSHLSLAIRMAAHPAYRQIIQMGPIAVPMILEELRKKPDHWFIALEEITGENPVPKGSEGKVAKMAEAWITWGVKKGYIK